MIAPTAPLSDPAIAALHRLEVRLAGLADGESTLINGVVCTGVSARVADLLTRHDRLQSRCQRLSERAVTTEDYNQLLDWQVVLADCRCQLAAAGRLDLIAEAADDHAKTKDPLPSRPRGPHPYRTAVTS